MQDASSRKWGRAPGWLAAAGVLLTASASPAAALDYQVHGFAAQGFALSEGNNIIGDSTHGNYQFFEIGVNGTLDTGVGLRFAAQELVRRTGELDDGDLRLDYGFVDYQALGGSGVDLGVRAGRVKNPFGLFNETRDVVFTRPGILLPLSVYFETQGARSLLFSSDGGQLYGGWSHGEQYTSLSVTRAADFSVSEDDKKIFFAGSTGFGGDLRFSDFLMARLMHEWGAGRLRIAASYLQANLSYAPAATDPFPVPGDLDFHIYLLSAGYNAERFSVTAEYQITHSEGNFGGPTESEGDGGYLQADYRFTPRWSAMARLDASYTDRDDRDGDQCSSGFGGPVDRHECFTRGAGVGLRWQPSAQWGVWGEYYRFDGTSQVPTIENLDRAKDPHWDLLLFMAAYRF